MHCTIFLIIAIVAHVNATSVRLCHGENGIIQLPTGRYVGANDPDTSTTAYFGIPYAYAERFNAATAVDDKPGSISDALVNASSHGPACVNFDLPPPYDVGFSFLLGDKPVEPQSEDCLTVDVYVPDGSHSNLPVLFFTPGGGFLVGASYSYDMRPLVARSAAVGRPFIAVVVNYRLGPLGFLNPSTSQNVNLGLLDQVEALRWVQRHIVAFGGSREKVTIMGQSAGAESTMHQLLWTDGDLFRAAFLSSVPSSSAPFLAHTPTNKDPIIVSYAEACGCPANKSVRAAVECLRQTDVTTMVSSSVAWEGSGTSLGGFVRANVFDTIRAGQFSKVPLLISMCRDEGTSEAIGFESDSDNITSLLLNNLISGAKLPPDASADFLQQMLAAYPVDPAVGCPFDGLNTTYGQPSQYKRMAAIATDATYAEAWSEYLKMFSRHTPTWGILFKQPVPAGTGPAFGAMHGADLAYYFPTLSGLEHDPRLHGQVDLVNAMQDALIRFVNDGNPNGRKAGQKAQLWPLFADTGLVASLDAADIVTPLPPPHRPGFDVLQDFLRPE